jgi:hypothetical protein
MRVRSGCTWEADVSLRAAARERRVLIGKLSGTRRAWRWSHVIRRPGRYRGAMCLTPRDLYGSDPTRSDAVSLFDRQPPLLRDPGESQTATEDGS